MPLPVYSGTKNIQKGHNKPFWCTYNLSNQIVFRFTFIFSVTFSTTFLSKQSRLLTIRLINSIFIPVNKWAHLKKIYRA